MTHQEYLYETALSFLEDNIYLDEEDCLTEYDERRLDNEDWTWKHGASKLAIILDNCVLKTTFTGHVRNIDDIDRYDDTEYIYDTDFSELEEALYNKAKERGIEQFFVKTERVGITKVFQQEKCVCSISDWSWDADFYKEDLPEDFELKEYFDSNKYSSDYIYDYCETIELCSLVNSVGPEVMNYLLAQYSVEDLKKLQNFVEEYNINDIEDRNTGITSEGKIKFFDFCGFMSQTCERVYAD